MELKRCKSKCWLCAHDPYGKSDRCSYWGFPLHFNQRACKQYEEWENMTESKFHALEITDSQYVVINDVAIKGEHKATSQHLVLIKTTDKKQYHLIQHWGDGSYRFIGCLWTRDEAYEELKARINASL